MRLDKKHRKEFSVAFSQLDGGVNYSVPPEAIADNELADAMNFVYDPYTFRPMKRPALTQYSTGVPLDGEINGLHKYVYSSGSYIVCTYNGTLYYLDGALAFVEIGSIGGTGAPTFLDFNGKVIIANGKLWSWDGTTLTDLTTDDSAPKTSCIFSWGGRVLTIGDTDLPHQVKLSGPGDETDWDDVSGAAYRFDIDEATGEGIIGGNLLGSNIIVFKGPQQRGIYRLIIPNGDFATAYVESFSNKSSCLNYLATLQYAGNLFFMDNNGFGSLRGIQEYGDIGQEPTGSKINSAIIPSLSSSYAMLFDFPYYNQVWIKYANLETMFAYNPIRGSFMPIKFPGHVVQSACYIESSKTLLLGMEDGYIYYLDVLSYQDQTQIVQVPYAEYAAFLKGKRFFGPKDSSTGSMYQKLLKNTVLQYEGLAVGSLTLEALTDGGSVSTTLLSETLDTGDLLIGEDLTSIIYGDTGEIFATSFNNKISRVQKLYYDLQYQLSCNEGAMKMNRIEGQNAFVGRK